MLLECPGLALAHRGVLFFRIARDRRHHHFGLQRRHTHHRADQPGVAIRVAAQFGKQYPVDPAPPCALRPHAPRTRTTGPLARPPLLPRPPPPPPPPRAPAPPRH